MQRVAPAHAHGIRAPCDEVRLLAEAGFPEDARKRAHALLALWPDDAEIVGLLGALAHREGALSEAIRHWNRLYDLLAAPPQGEMERLGLLAAANDQAPSPAGWMAAARTWDLLARSGKLSAYGRLARIRRRLGNEEGALRAERAFEEAFRRRMHWLTPEERMAALLHRPLPLQRLRALALPPFESLGDPLAQSIALLARGRTRAARRILSFSDSDAGWRSVAHLAATEGEEACRLASSWLLERDAPDGPMGLVLAQALALAPNARPPYAALERARAALERMAHRVPPDEEALFALAVLAARMGRHDDAHAFVARLKAARRRPWPPAGVVRAAAIYSLRGRQRGLVHDVIARRFPARAGEGGRLLDAEIHGEFAPGGRAQIRRIFAAVREFLLARLPERRAAIDAWAYGLHVTKEDQPSGGPSIGLPVAMAFASAMLDRPVPGRMVFSGALSYDALGRIAVQPVGDAGLKLKGALHAGATLLILPRAQRDEVLSGQHVPRRIAEGSVAFVETFEEALALLPPTPSQAQPERSPRLPAHTRGGAEGAPPHDDR